MRRPSQFPHSIFMSEHSGQRPLLRGPDIKRADGTVNTGCGQNGRTVLVPVVGEGLSRRGRATRLAGDCGRGGSGVDGDLSDEVV